MNMRAYLSEFTGTTILLATVIGSGIMGETLANGNAAIALLGNTIATGAILYVLITIFGPISGAHFNPTVTVAMLIAKKINAKDAIIFIILQILGAGLGVLIAHGMFELDIFQISSKYKARCIARFLRNYSNIWVNTRNFWWIETTRRCNTCTCWVLYYISILVYCFYKFC